MKTLLRSTFLVRPDEDGELFLRNAQALRDSGLKFEGVEDAVLWNFVQDFITQHHHVPDYVTLKNHFEYLKEQSVVDQIQTLSILPPRVRGNFLLLMEERVQDHRTRQTANILKEAARILETGITLREAGKDRILKGSAHAIQYVLERGHDIVMPSTGTPLSGDVTTDGDNFLAEYDRVESDPLAGMGQYTGIQQLDDALRGAKRAELWTHAAWTGGLKCVAGDTRIWDVFTGNLRTVHDIYETQKFPVVHALDTKTWKIMTAQVDAVQQSGVRQILRVTSEKNRIVRVSENHPFLTPSGWVRADRLQVDDWIATPAKLPNNCLSCFTDTEVLLLGYLLGDGGITNNGLTFTNGNQDIIEHFESCLCQYGYAKKTPHSPYDTTGLSFTLYPKKGESSVDIHISRSSGKQQPWISPLRKLLDDLGLWGCTASTKHIPGALWAISDRQAWLLLSALWSTDGRATVEGGRKNRKPKARFWYGSTSKQLCVDVQALLQRLGVPSTITKSITTYKGQPYNAWVTTITTMDGLARFLHNTKIIGKETETTDAKNTLTPYDGDWVPTEFLSCIGDDIRAPSKSKGWLYNKRIRKREKVQRDTFRRLSLASKNTELICIAEAEVNWERVRSVVPDGKEMTYDLSVPGPANFVANGFITHNSTFSANWAYNQAIFYKHSSIFFSLEMPYTQDRRIFYAIHSGHDKFKDIRKALGLGRSLDYTRIRNGELDRYSDDEIKRMSPEQQAKLIRGNTNPERPEKRFLEEFVVPDMKDPANEYGHVYYEVANPEKSDFTMADLRSKAELLYSKDPDIRTIYVDHAGLMSPRHRASSTTENLNEIVRDLKRLSMSFNRGMGIAVVSLFQISREGFKMAEKSDGRYSLTALSYSNECERSSDIVTTTYVDDSLRDRNLARFQCLKARDDKPFDVFYAGVHWPSRRVYTTHDVSATEAQQAGDKIDSGLLDD